LSVPSLLELLIDTNAVWSIYQVPRERDGCMNWTLGVTGSLAMFRRINLILRRLQMAHSVWHGGGQL